MHCTMKRVKMSGGCTRPCTVLLKRVKMSGRCTRPCTVYYEKELKCLVDVQDHALYYEKELKCLVDLQDHALSHNKCMGLKKKTLIPYKIQVCTIILDGHIFLSFGMFKSLERIK